MPNDPPNPTRYDSVWDAISDDIAEAENLKLRSQLTMTIASRIEQQDWTQAEAARQLGLSQPRISDLMRGKIDRFGLDKLVNIALAAGLLITIKVQDAA